MDKEYWERIFRLCYHYVLCPETEKDYFDAVNFWVEIILRKVVPNWWIDPIGGHGFDWDHGKFSYEDITNSLTPEVLDPLANVVRLICQKFNVASPACKKAPKGKKSFRCWYEKVCRKERIVSDYPDYVLDKIL